jgi:daunorubicin resistance ABC transporter ATP-binding subunit
MGRSEGSEHGSKASQGREIGAYWPSPGDLSPTDELRPPAATTAIEIEGLRKSFGEVVALDGLDLQVETGTIFGLLGPNGAGKTTLVRIVATLLAPDAGRAAVLGHDVVREPLAVRRRIGLAGQFAAVDGELTGRENVEMIGRLYRLSAAETRRRAGEVLERFGLADAADRRVAGYSGGMRRRLDLAAGLIGRPPVVLLDEPTTGLDPRSRQELWSVVEELRLEGTTVLLTTQYLEEADRLAQRIAVVDRGRIAAQGTAAQLKAAIGGNVLSVRLADPSDVPVASAALSDLSTGEQPRVDAADSEIRLAVAGPGVSTEALRRLDARHLAIASIELQQPSLDDVFLNLTGRPAAPEPPDEPLAQEAA